MSFTLENIIRYIQELTPSEAKVIQSYAAARLTALSQSADGTSANYGRNAATRTVDGSVRNIKLAIDDMVVGDAASLKTIEATARALSALDTDESSSSYSSLSSLSSSSMSSSSISTSSLSSSSSS